MDGQAQYAIEVKELSKCYQMYNRPQDRLKQLVASKVPLINKMYYSEFWALHEVSFAVRKGETVGIIGRNGSGKSTLLQIIAGTIRPTNGSVRVDGRVSALLELGSGFNPEFTGLENVYLSGSLLGIPRDEMDKRMNDIASFADIGDFLYQPVKTYSSGMHARLAFAVAINVDPEILIVDEILSVGDAAFQAKCTRAFHRIRDKGCTVLLVTQDPYLVRTFCTTALYLRRGKVIGFGNPADVTDSYLREIESAQIHDRQTELAPEVIESAAADETVTSSNVEEGGALYRIENLRMLDEAGNVLHNVSTGQCVTIEFHYKKLAPSKHPVVFVFSLYRHDDLYICGTTTLMDGYRPVAARSEGTVRVAFPNFRLLSGDYKWRVAIDDERGLGIYTETYSDLFNVKDEMESVGLFHLERTWQIDGEEVG